MAEVVGGPIDLKVCEDCPRRDRGQDLNAGPGKAAVVVSESGIRGIYISSDGRSTGNFQESSTAIYMDARGGYEAFAGCDQPIKDGFLQKIGLAQATCPALEELVGGQYSDGDIIAEYLEQGNLQPSSN